MTTELPQIQKFNGDNFHPWKFQMKIILEAKDLLSIIDGSEVKPEIEDIAKFSEWKKKDAKSKMLITTALEFKYIQQIVNCQTSAEMWKKLSTIYELKSETNKYLLQQRFFEYKMNPNANIASHISKVETQAQQMKDLGEPISDVALITKIICSLPDKYKNFITAWDSVSSEEKTLENLTARLLKEESLQDHWDYSGNFKPDNALMTFSKFNRNSTASNKQQQHQQSIKDKKNKTHCGYCKKKGHWWKECYKRKEEQKGQQPSSSVRDDSCAFSDETSAFLTETKDSWIADSGATDHMTFRREWFSTFEEIPGVHPVCLGDGKKIYAKAMNSYCSKCKKKGHYAKVCRSEAINEIKSEIAFLGSVEDNSKKWIVPIKVNNRQVNFKNDTGADVNVLPLQNYYQSFQRIKLEKSDKVLQGLNGIPLETVGMIHVKLQNKGHHLYSKIYIVDKLKQPLLSGETSEKLNIVRMIQQLSSNFLNPKREFPKIFNGLGHAKINYKISLQPDAKPYALCTLRRVPIPLMKQVKEQLEEMTRLGVIESVEEPTEWCAGMVAVSKPGGKIRICVDLTKLNQYIRRENYPLPATEHILGQLGNACYFSKLDANSGFWQFGLAKESQKLTTFITPFGRFFFKRIPFGITSAPEIFQRKMTQLLGNIEGVVCFMDDIEVYGSSLEEHNERKSVNLELKLKFLGHTLSSEGLFIDEEKLDAITKMEAPRSTKELKSFLGMVWDEHQKKSFNLLKQELVSRPNLALFDPSRTTIVSTDASSFGIGGVLRQEQPDGYLKPIAYVSRTLSKTEKRYSQIGKEGLAIVWTCDRLKDYVTGIKIHIETDHKPLIAIFTSKSLEDMTPRLQRLKMRMMRYSYQISHIAGKKKIVADMLSRKPMSKPHKDELEEELSAYIQSIEFPATEERLLEISRKQKEDSLCSQLAKYCMSGWPKNKREVDPELRGYWQFQEDLTYQNGLLLRGQRILIPKTLRKDILEKLHQGHFGINKCRSRAKESVWWLGISQEIERMVSSCTKCLKERKPKHEPLMPSEFPIRPWQKVGMDLFYLNGRWYLIVCDYYSRYPEISLLKNLTAQEVIGRLKSIFARHGTPETVRSDNGPQFQKVLGSEFSKFSKEWSFKHITSSPKFPQSNGFFEAIIKNIKQSFKKEEDCYLTLQAYRTMPLESGYSPAELLMGRRLRTSVPAIESSLMPRRNRLHLTPLPKMGSTMDASEDDQDDQEQETEEDCPTPTASSARDGRMQRDNQDQDPEKSLPSMPAVHTRYGRADDFSRFRVAYFIRHKSDVLEKFKEFVKIVRTETGNKIKRFRTDNGTEFLNKNFSDYLKSLGIVHELTAPYTPEQNGISERDNRTIVESARSVSGNLFRRKPSILHLKTFGCNAYVHIPKDNRKKLDKKSICTFFVGYTEANKNYRMWDPIARKIVISRDVIFTEANTSENIQDNQQEQVTIYSQESVDSTNTSSKPEESCRYPLRNRIREKEQSSTNCTIAISNACYVHNQEPLNYEDAIVGQNSKKWKLAMDDEFKSLMKNQTWTYVTLPSDRKAIACKWVYKIKQNADGSNKMFKARLVAKGYLQKSGLDYGETFSPVVKFYSIRTILSLCASLDMEMIQLDVKSAFLNGDLEEELYMEQPQGYENPDFPNHVCSLQKSIYGLKQSPRMWNKKFHEFLIKFDLKPSISDSCVYTMKSSYIERTREHYNLLEIKLQSVPSDPYSKLTKEMCPKDNQEIEEMNKIPYKQTIESEYIAASKATKEAIWLRQLLRELHQEQVKPTTIFCDNQSCIRLVHNPEYHKRTKHIDISYHFIRDQFQKHAIDLLYVCSNDRAADIFTKALPPERYRRLRRQLGLFETTKCLLGGSVGE
ncbi:K02A2.6-like [Cordylochernes scorpioides]|uniref:RNA-directed DNA polymerase n=1 Tax=Cordylochernes scorpioides TaxID=51811 RepID=A0ABY6LQS6_9ARAC|nr:K02A2.6-like [Cordylochernes scorpioides]